MSKTDEIDQIQSKHQIKSNSWQRLPAYVRSNWRGSFQTPCQTGLSLDLNTRSNQGLPVPTTANRLQQTPVCPDLPSINQISPTGNINTYFKFKRRRRSNPNQLKLPFPHFQTYFVQHIQFIKHNAHSPLDSITDQLYLENHHLKDNYDFLYENNKAIHSLLESPTDEDIHQLSFPEIPEFYPETSEKTQDFPTLQRTLARLHKFFTQNQQSF